MTDFVQKQRNILRGPLFYKFFRKNKKSLTVYPQGFLEIKYTFKCTIKYAPAVHFPIVAPSSSPILAIEFRLF
jgi:hypothetical protein